MIENGEPVQMWSSCHHDVWRESEERVKEVERGVARQLRP